MLGLVSVIAAMGIGSVGFLIGRENPYPPRLRLLKTEEDVRAFVQTMWVSGFSTQGPPCASWKPITITPWRYNEKSLPSYWKERGLMLPAWDVECEEPIKGSDNATVGYRRLFFVDSTGTAFEPIHP